MAHDARAVANFLLDLADRDGRPVTVMQLLKIVYFAHGWHLARTGRPLVSNGFEAWEHGPVVRSVWNCFRDLGDKPVTNRAKKFDVQSGEFHVVSESFDYEEIALITDVYRAYGGFDAFQLSRMTHEPGSPWDLVRNAPDGKVTVGMRITDRAIRDHFLHSRPPSVAH